MAVTKKQKLTSIAAANKLLEQAEKRIDALKKMVESERAKEKGYAEIAKVHSAYIAILLNKLGATADNTITINAKEVTKAMEKYEARAMYSPENKSYSLYCEVIE